MKHRSTPYPGYLNAGYLFMLLCALIFILWACDSDIDNESQTEDESASSLSSTPNPDNTATMTTDGGVIQIENRSENQFGLINIVPCDFSSAPWGPNQLADGSILGPDDLYQVNGIPAGCYSVRICLDKERYDNSDCIIYHQNIYVENNLICTISIGPN